MKEGKVWTYVMCILAFYDVGIQVKQCNKCFKLFSEILSLLLTSNDNE